LRTVVAVLRAEAALGIDEHVEVDAVTAVGAAHAIGGGQELENLLIRAVEYRTAFISR
jgi:hypothetical protein